MCVIFLENVCLFIDKSYFYFSYMCDGQRERFDSSSALCSAQPQGSLSLPQSLNEKESGLVANH